MFGGLGGIVAKWVKARLGITHVIPAEDLWEYDNLRSEDERRWGW